MVGLGVSLEHIEGAIGGAVVDNDDLERAASFAEICDGVEERRRSTQLFPNPISVRFTPSSARKKIL